jgi:hypothetical protein
VLAFCFGIKSRFDQFSKLSHALQAASFPNSLLLPLENKGLYRFPNTFAVNCLSLGVIQRIAVLALSTFVP